MNTNRSKASERSTNFLSLSSKIANIKKEIKPVLKCSRARSNPPARLIGSNQWVNRVFRVKLSVPTNAGLISITGKTLADSLGVIGTDAIDMKILDFSVWNTTPAGQTTNYLSVSPTALVAEDQTTAAGEGFALFEDFGTASSLPSAHVNVPDLISKINRFGPSSAQEVVILRSTPFTTVPATSAQTLVADFHCLVRTA